jgi:hypothetical protein
MMEKIFSLDKILHFVVGALITALVALFVPVAAPAAFLVAVVAGFTKEIFDRFTDGKFDFLDLFATWAGGLIVQMLIWIFL